jgi:hypothetical protein
VNPHAVSPAVTPQPNESSWVGPTGRDFRALTLPRVPCSARRVNTAPKPDAPLGFSLSRALRRTPWTCLPQALLSRASYCGDSAYRRNTGTSESQSASAWPAPTTRTSRTAGPNSPPKVSVPCQSQVFEPIPVRAMGSPRGSTTVTGRLPRSLDQLDSTLPEPLRTRL